MHSLNWLAIFVAAISTMVMGFLWYSPLLFAKPWMREMGCDPNDKAKIEEMRKGAAAAYGGFLCCQPAFRFHPGLGPPRASGK